jgi:hypothetical protein
MAMCNMPGAAPCRSLLNVVVEVPVQLLTGAGPPCSEAVQCTIIAPPARRREQSYPRLDGAQVLLVFIGGCKEYGEQVLLVFKGGRKAHHLKGEFSRGTCWNV